MAVFSLMLGLDALAGEKADKKQKLGLVAKDSNANWQVSVCLLHTTAAMGVQGQEKQLTAPNKPLKGAAWRTRF